MAELNTNYNVVKKPSQESLFTEEEFNEFIKCGTDFFYFLRNYCYVQHPAVGACLFKPRVYQKDMLDMMRKERFVIFNSSRQSGKTASAAVYLVHSAIFRKDQKIGVTSRRDSDVIDIMNRIKYVYENLPWWLKPGVTEYNKKTIAFTNNSSIEAATTTDNTFRGRSMTKIFIDEFSHVKPDIAENFWSSILPVITAATEDGKESNTQVIIASTPNGTEGQYAEIWFNAVNGENGFAHYEVDPDQIPGRDANFEKEMLKKMTYEKYMQEYRGAFLSSKPTLIRSTVLESIKKVQPVYNDNELYMFDSVHDRKVALSVDVGEGIGQDYHTIQCFDIDTLEQIFEFRNNVLTQTAFTKYLIKLMKYCFDEGAKEVYYGIESNSIGMGVINLMINSTDPVLEKAIMVNDTKNHPRKRGIPTTSNTKKRGCMLLKDLVENYKMTIRSERLISELKFFVKKGVSYASERVNGHDDLVMSTVVFCNMLEILSRHEETVYDTLNDIDVSEGEEDYVDEPMPII